MSDESVVGCLPIQLETGHRREIQSIIDTLRELVAGCRTELSLALSRFSKLVFLYSEEPSLLDSLLPSLVDRLLSYVSWPTDKDSGQPPLTPLSIEALNLLQVLMRVRGYKVFMRLLPHEVNYLKPLVICLEYYSQCNNVTEANASAPLVFVLSAWLTIICKNPFNLAKFDGAKQSQTNGGNTNKLPIADRIVNCMSGLQRHFILHVESNIISNLLAQILTRNEDGSEMIVFHVDKAIEIIRAFESELNGGAILISKLRLLNSIFKYGKRENLKTSVNRLLDATLDRLLGVNCANTLVRLLIVKLLQRVAFVLLRPRLATWRYRCGYRSIEDSLRLITANNNAANTKIENDASEFLDEDNADDDIPYELIEKLIEELLNKIHDNDGLVRWAAAKGVAKICARLPKALGGEIVSAVLRDSFVDEASAKSWHGGCLTVAELCRRGCLLPEHVPEVIDKVLKRALFFDKSLELVSLATGVRDAACYICWAFARGYERNLLRNCLPKVAGFLVCLALFDREINVRRAASAAFQENVGRNSCFPHGIPVLTLIGYTDVTLIRHCYLNLSLSVANFAEYRRSILEHLATVRSTYWDESLRELTAQALQVLAPIDVEYCRDIILPLLTRKLKTKDPAVKHGAIIAIASVLRGLAEANVSASSIDIEKLSSFIHNNLSLIKNHRVDGYALLCKAFCRFIGVMCAVGTSLSDDQLNEYHDVLDTVISDKNTRLHSYAVEAFDDLMKIYENNRFRLLKCRIHDNYFVKMGNTSVELTRSSAILPLAQIPAVLLTLSMENDTGVNIESDIHGDVILADLIIVRLIGSINDSATPKWVFARVAAIRCISAILCKCIPLNLEISVIIDTLINATEDYTTTTSGDIGRFTRREAISALVKILPIAFKHDGDSKLSRPSNLLLTTAVQHIITRCCEAIDDLRVHACVSMADLLKMKISPTGEADNAGQLAIPERQLLESIFFVDEHPSDGVSSVQSSGRFTAIDWLHTSGYLRLESLLRSPTYGLSALEGFIMSAGSIAAWTSENAYNTISIYVKRFKKDKTKVEAFIDDILKVYARLVAHKRSIIIVLQLFLMLLNDRAFAVLEEDPDSSTPFNELTDKVMRIAIGRGSPKVKRIALTILGALLQFSQTSKLYRNCASALVSFLSSPYVTLREVASEQLFNTINMLDFNDITECTELAGKKERMLALLTTTPWLKLNHENEQKPELVELLSLLTSSDMSVDR